MMQPFPRPKRLRPDTTPVLVENESGRRERDSGQFLARSITRSVRQSLRPSVRPSVSTRFVALSDLDLGCGGGGEREEKEGGIGGEQVLEELPLGLVLFKD